MKRSNYTRYEVISPSGDCWLDIRRNTFDDTVSEINDSVARAKERGYNDDGKWLILQVDGCADWSDDGVFIASSVTKKAVAMYDNGTVTMIGGGAND